MSNARAAAVLAKFDKNLQGREDATVKRVEAILRESFDRLEGEVIKRYNNFTPGAKPDLLPAQRALLLLDEVKDLAKLINPSQEATIQNNFDTLLGFANSEGYDLGKDLAQAIAGKDLALNNASVPLGAVTEVARAATARLKRRGEGFADRAANVIGVGLAQGWGAQKTAGLLRRELGTTQYDAERIIRTESIQAQDGATRKFYKDQQIDYVQRIGTQDRRICPYCAARVGHVYELGKAPAVIHPFDRCYNMPFKPEWLEEGLVDAGWLLAHRRDILNKLEGEPNTGPAPFEKSAGLKAPEPIWTIQNGYKTGKPPTPPVPPVVPTAVPAPTPTRPNPPGPRTYKEFIQKGGEYLGSANLKRLEAALKPSPQLRKIQKELDDLEKVVIAQLERGEIVLGGVKDTPESTRYRLLQRQEYALRNSKSEGERLTTQMGTLRDQLIQRSPTNIVSARKLADGVKITPAAAKIVDEEVLRVRLTQFFQLTRGQGSNTLQSLVKDTSRNGDRAWADRYAKEINIGRQRSPGEELIVLFHEGGHHVEYGDPILLRAAKDFIVARAEGAPRTLKELTGTNYDKSETAYPDRFVDPYVGKIYPASTEVLSMGIQHFASPEEMAKLYKADKQHFLLTLGILTRND